MQKLQQCCAVCSQSHAHNMHDACESSTLHTLILSFEAQLLRCLLENE